MVIYLLQIYIKFMSKTPKSNFKINLIFNIKLLERAIFIWCSQYINWKFFKYFSLNLLLNWILFKKQLFENLNKNSWCESEADIDEPIISETREIQAKKCREVYQRFLDKVSIQMSFLISIFSTFDENLDP